mgnify:CR=1 FL=1
MIVRDEERNIVDCVKHLAPLVDEMIVVGQDIVDPFLTHRHHRNAVRQTVALVWSFFIKDKTQDK